MAANGSIELRALAVRLREAGDTRLLAEMVGALKAGAKPLISDVRDAAVRDLPHTGGLAARVAASSMTTSVRTGPRTAGVRLTGRSKAGRQLDRGFVDHPVFGDRGVWVHQGVPQATGWWSRTLAERSPAVTPYLLAVMKRTSAFVQGG